MVVRFSWGLFGLGLTYAEKGPQGFVWGCRVSGLGSELGVLRFVRFHTSTVCKVWKGLSVSSLNQKP